MRKIIQKILGLFIDRKMMTEFQDVDGKFLYYQHVKTCKRCGSSRPYGKKKYET